MRRAHLLFVCVLGLFPAQRLMHFTATSTCAARVTPDA
jgi:hypothetical protein